MLRPRLIVHQRAVITKLEYELAITSIAVFRQQVQQKLDRAREILRALEAA